jgi:hypothetical protein
MKTIRFLLLMAAAITVAFIGCSKYESENDSVPQLKSNSLSPVSSSENELSGIIKSWTEDFESPLNLTNNWKLYGDPPPKWIEMAHGKTGLFDNNGPSPTKNFAVSNLSVGSGCGFTVMTEVLLDVLNPEGSCICPGIAISKDSHPVLKNGEFESGISMRIIYAGAGATWFPLKLRGHTWIIMTYLNDQNVLVNSNIIQADNYNSSWIQFKIDVTPNRLIRFYCNDQLLWAPTTRLLRDMTINKKVLLGYTSDGNPITRAGVAYHNYVKTSYYFSNSIPN